MSKMELSSEQADRELLAAIAQGDASAFSVLYRRYLPSVVGLLLRETRDRELAADLTAEVFAALLLSARSYRCGSAETAAPWIFGIARNKLRLSRRRKRAEDRARRRLGWEREEINDDDLMRVDEMATGSEAVREMLSLLPPREQRAVRQHVIEEQGYTEIATDLGCSEMVVRQQVSRGLKRLRQRLTEVRDG